MLDTHDSWWLDETPADDPLDLLSMPEFKRAIATDRGDAELGLRSLLERPELVLSPGI